MSTRGTLRTMNLVKINQGPDDGGNTCLWNVGRHSIKNTAVHPRRFWASYSLPWELEISISQNLPSLWAVCVTYWVMKMNVSIHTVFISPMHKWITLYNITAISNIIKSKMKFTVINPQLGFNYDLTLRGKWMEVKNFCCLQRQYSWGRSEESIYTKRGSSGEMIIEVKETILWTFITNGKPVLLW
jgi:hypothetical protein